MLFIFIQYISPAHAQFYLSVWFAAVNMNFNTVEVKLSLKEGMRGDIPEVGISI